MIDEEKDQIIPEQLEESSDSSDGILDEYSTIADDLNDANSDTSPNKKVGVVRYNYVAPKNVWGKVPEKFKTGDIVVNIQTKELMKVKNPANKIGYYTVQASKDKIVNDINGDYLRPATEKEAKEYVPYTLWQDRFNIPGFKVSCPSNNLSLKDASKMASPKK